MHPLLGYHRYQWLLVCRDEFQTSGGVRGSEGVACLVRDDIFKVTSIVHSDAFARFMWLQIGWHKYRKRDIFIIVCHFSPTSSPYAIHDLEDGDPYFDLQESSSQFEALGDIIILGDFNDHTKDHLIPLYDHGSDLNCISKLDPTTKGLQLTSEDVLGSFSIYGRPPPPAL